MMYTYHYRKKPNLTIPFPEGVKSVWVRSEAKYDRKIKCCTFGRVKYKRPLTTMEKTVRGLVDDPANYMLEARG